MRYYIFQNEGGDHKTKEQTKHLRLICGFRNRTCFEYTGLFIIYIRNAFLQLNLVISQLRIIYLYRHIMEKGVII